MTKIMRNSSHNNNDNDLYDKDERYSYNNNSSRYLEKESSYHNNFDNKLEEKKIFKTSYHNNFDNDLCDKFCMKIIIIITWIMIFMIKMIVFTIKFFL